MVQELAARVQSMKQQLQASEQRRQTETAALQVELQRAQAAQQQQQQQSGTTAGGNSGTSVIDTRVLGKPDTFDDVDAKWKGLVCRLPFLRPSC